MAFPSLNADGQIQEKINRVYDFTCAPQLLITLLDTERPRGDMISKLNSKLFRRLVNIQNYNAFLRIRRKNR